MPKGGWKKGVPKKIGRVNGLIKMSNELGLPILCRNTSQRKSFIDKANEAKIEISHPLCITQLYSDIMDEKDDIPEEGFLINDKDDVINLMFDKYDLDELECVPVCNTKVTEANCTKEYFTVAEIIDNFEFEYHAIKVVNDTKEMFKDTTGVRVITEWVPKDVLKMLVDKITISRKRVVTIYARSGC